MMSNSLNKYSKLKAYFSENGITQNEISSLLDQPCSKVDLKLNDKRFDFTLSEAKKICEKYVISADDFFIY